MRYLLYFFLILGIHNAQVTGLDGWDLFIDPGHSQDENMGINGYSEAKEVLQVGLELMDILNSQSDIDTGIKSIKNTIIAKLPKSVVTRTLLTQKSTYGNVKKSIREKIIDNWTI